MSNKAEIPKRKSIKQIDMASPVTKLVKKALMAKSAQRSKRNPDYIVDGSTGMTANAPPKQKDELEEKY